MADANETELATQIENNSPPKDNTVSAAAVGEEESDEEKPFHGSTHRYLVYFQHTKNVSDFILGVITMVIQFVLYSIMIKEGFDQIKGDKVAVITSWGNCGAIDYSADSWTGWGGGALSNTDSLECATDDPTTGTIMGGFTLSCILFVYFIAYDILACIKIWFKIPGLWAKLMGAGILFEALFAFYTGVIFAFIAVGNGSSYDAIVNCIGVLFVHDLDEKMCEAAELIKRDEMTGKCCGACGCCAMFKRCFKCCCIVCVLISSIAVGFICVGIIAATAFADDGDSGSDTASP